MNIIRMLTTKDEIDILLRNIEWYANQGISTVAIDNGSTDGSYELMKGLEKDKILACKQLITDGYQEQTLLNSVHELAKSFNPEWLVLADADEFYESPLVGENFRTGLERTIKQGFNLLKLNNMEFWMTEKDNPNEKDVLKRIRHYSFYDNMRYKAYPNMQGIDIATKLGHMPIFLFGSQINLCPELFISRHYKFRSLEQGYKKIKQVAPTKDKPDQNFHYVKFKCEPSHFVIPSHLLNEYKEDKKWDMTRKFDGGRMNNTELMAYLGFTTTEKLNKWLDRRNLQK